MQATLLAVPERYNLIAEFFQTDFIREKLTDVGVDYG